jgi:putative FmdB family regulatory protein
MPMYEYRCEECGQSYEQLRRMSEADINLECPYCGSEEVERQVSACAIGGASKGGGCGPSSSRGFS